MANQLLRFLLIYLILSVTTYTTNILIWLIIQQFYIIFSRITVSDMMAKVDYETKDSKYRG